MTSYKRARDINVSAARVLFKLWFWRLGVLLLPTGMSVTLITCRWHNFTYFERLRSYRSSKTPERNTDWSRFFCSCVLGHTLKLPRWLFLILQLARDLCLSKMPWAFILANLSTMRCHLELIWSYCWRYRRKILTIPLFKVFLRLNKMINIHNFFGRLFMLAQKIRIV